jgi:chaperonin GroES
MSIRKVKPLYDRVLIKRADAENISAGGIIIPDTAQEKTQWGTIEAIGTGKVMTDGSIRPLTVIKGDKVLFGKYSGTEIKVAGQDLLILKEEEILGVLE